MNVILGDQGIITKAQQVANTMYETEVNTQITFNNIAKELEQTLQTEEKITNIYVFLYDDGTLTLGTQNKPIEGKNVQKEYGNIKGQEYSSWTEEENKKSDTPWFNDSALITKVSIVDKIVPISMASWFDSCINLTEMENIENIDTSQVKSMRGLFDTCTSLQTIDVSSFNTTHVNNMENMFAYCNNLTQILGLEKLNTKKVESMASMFYYCTNLQSLNLSNFDTSNVTNMGWMFCKCESLTSLDMISFNTSNVTNMESMFAHCRNLTEILNLEKLDTSKVENMTSMFYHCENLKQLNVNSFNTSKVKTMGWMFEQCISLITLDVSSFDMRNVTNMNGMFSGCKNLMTIYVGDNWDLSKVENKENVFTNCGTDTTTLK